MAELVQEQNLEPVGAGAIESAQSAGHAALQQGRDTALASRIPELVKGKRLALIGGNKVLDDPNEIMPAAFAAQRALVNAVDEGKGRVYSGSVKKAFDPRFLSEFPGFAAGMDALSGGFGGNAPINQLIGALQDANVLPKNWSLGAGTSGYIGTQLVPFDLVAPSRLLYPVYSPFRDKMPRVPGQGTSHRGKLITGIPGSQTGANGAPVDISIPEFQGGGNFGSWPLNLPPAGSNPTGVDMNIPYMFFGTTEAVSWLAQFAGQGFEDVSALANLVLLQKMMLGEEYMLLAGTGTNLSKPGTPTLAARVAGSGETGLGVANSNYVGVAVTATNYYGETIASNIASVQLPSSGATSYVVDVTISAVRGAFQYNIYSASGGSAPTTVYLTKSGVGGVRFTLQGITLPSSGTTPPTADSGTGAATRYEGIKSILDGHASTDASVYPSGILGGYANLAAASHLSSAVIETALLALWDGTYPGGGGAFRANPAELIGEGGDLKRLSDDIQNDNITNYRLEVMQAEVAGITMGQAVTEFVNPMTRSIVKLLVHPWLSQGNAFLMSYTLPMSWSNTGNAWEVVNVQDYLSVSWPVIDASFRYSIFMYGTLWCPAPMYSGVISGLQVSDSTPYQ